MNTTLKLPEPLVLDESFVLKMGGAFERDGRTEDFTIELNLAKLCEYLAGMARHNVSGKAVISRNAVKFAFVRSAEKASTEKCGTEK